MFEFSPLLLFLLLSPLQQTLHNLTDLSFFFPTELEPVLLFFELTFALYGRFLLISLLFLQLEVSEILLGDIVVLQMRDDLSEIIMHFLLTVL